MKRIRAVVVAAALALTACTPEMVTVERTDFSKFGAGTPRTEIEAVLGQPTNSWEGPEGRILAYEYDQGAGELKPLLDPKRVEQTYYICGNCAAAPILALSVEFLAYPFRRSNQIADQKGTMSILYDHGDVMIAASFASNAVENRNRLLKHARLVKRAEAGDRDAQYEMAEFSSSATEREEFYRLAAAQGHVEAQYKLATLYADPLEAWDLLCRAATEGNVQAQGELADRYRLGEAPLAADPIKAYLWYRIAEQSGYENASDQNPGYYKTEGGLACCRYVKQSEMTAEQMSEAEVAEAESLFAEGLPDLASCQADGGAPTDAAGKSP